MKQIRRQVVEEHRFVEAKNPHPFRYPMVSFSFLGRLYGALSVEIFRERVTRAEKCEEAKCE